MNGNFMVRMAGENRFYISDSCSHYIWRDLSIQNTTHPLPYCSGDMYSYPFGNFRTFEEAQKILNLYNQVQSKSYIPEYVVEGHTFKNSKSKVEWFVKKDERGIDGYIMVSEDGRCQFGQGLSVSSFYSEVRKGNFDGWKYIGFRPVPTSPPVIKVYDVIQWGSTVPYVIVKMDGSKVSLVRLAVDSISSSGRAMFIVNKDRLLEQLKHKDVKNLGMIDIIDQTGY